MAITFALGFVPKWYIADLVGRPLGGGYMATFSSLNFQELKLVFQLPDPNFPWPYVTIPNVGSLGILFDENGSQGPFYFEFDSSNPTDNYYLEIYDHDGVLQWTIDNYNGGSGGGGGSTTIALSIQNLITNNIFYRNIGASANPIGVNYLPLAPGAHEGLAPTVSNAGPDIVFVRNGTGATDQLTFTPFILGDTPFAPDVTPPEFLNYTCGGPASGETFKVIQFPITHNVQNLSGEALVGTIWARSNGGTATLTLKIRQFFGDGAGASPDNIVAFTVLTLTNVWAQYPFSVTIPSVATSPTTVIGGCHNDGLFFQVQYPLNATCNIDFTKLVLVTGSTTPSITYETDDQINAVISSPRTADTKTSFNYSGANYIPGGWVFMNDGSIGNPSSNASTRAKNDTFPLYNCLWNGISDFYCTVVNSAGIPTGRGASAIADFTANNAIFIPKALGRVFSGAANGIPFFTKVFGVVASTLIVNDATPFISAMPVTVANTGGALPTPLLPSTTYFVIVLSSTTLALATTYQNAVNGIFITLTSTGSGTNTIAGNPISPNLSHPLGEYMGEDSHALLPSELTTHTHPPLSGLGFEVLVAAGGIANGITGTVLINQPTTGATGGNNPFNILQPTTYANYIIKL